MRRILTICTGNICRSPLAAALLKSRLSSSHDVESAGVAAVVGHPPTPEAAKTAADRGLDVSLHRARQLDAPLASSFDLLLVMEKAQKRWITANIPQARGRTFVLGHWRDVEIPDPYGAPIEDYEQACRLIEACAGDWLDRL